VVNRGGTVEVAHHNPVEGSESKGTNLQVSRRAAAKLLPVAAEKPCCTLECLLQYGFGFSDLKSIALN